MLHLKEVVEIGSDNSKIMILMSRTNNVLGHQKKIEDEELESFLQEDLCQTLKELSDSLSIEGLTVSKQ